LWSELDYFLGRFDYTMDDRGRIPVPPRYRDAFAVGPVLSQGPDPCLRLFTAANYNEQAALYTAGEATDESARAMRRHFFANSFSIDLDAQGRILVPPPLREFAGLTRDVTISGAGEWLEIWNPERFSAAMSAQP
jgi:MraZ protein